jgi:hypothetical protein
MKTYELSMLAKIYLNLLNFKLLNILTVTVESIKNK